MAGPETNIKIWMALRARIEAATELPIAWPKTSFAPNGDEYLSVSFLPPRPTRILIGSRGPHRHDGTLALRLTTPMADLRPVEVSQGKAARIAAAFGVDEPLAFQGVSVRVYELPEVQGGFRDDAWWMTPINIRWRCFA